MAAPMRIPKEREMMKYSPPPSTLRLVAISEMARAVGMVTTCPSATTATAPSRPRCPTA